MLNLTCIKDFSQSRRVYQSLQTIKVRKGDEITLIKADNLPDSDNLYWILSINDDDSYGNDSYGYLAHLDSTELQSHFE